MRKFFFFLFIFILITIVSNANHSKKKEEYGKTDVYLEVTDKRKKTVKNEYCTKSVKEIGAEGDEKIFEVLYYHEADPSKREINLKEISTVVRDRTFNSILGDLYCLGMLDRGSVAKQNDVKALALIHDAFLDSERSILKIPDGIILQISDLELNNAFYKEVVSEVQGPELPLDEGGDKPKPTEPTKPEPEPEPVFDTEKRDKLESAAEIKKLEFDEEINKLQGLKDEANTNYEQLKINYQTSLTKVDETLKYTKNTDILEIREKLKKLENLKKEHFEGTKLKSLKDTIRSIQTDIDGLVKSEDYKSIKKLITKIQNAEKKKNHSFIENQTVEKIEKRQLIEATGLEGKISLIKTDISTFDLIIQNSIDPLREEIDKLDLGDEEDKFVQFILDIAIYIAIFLFVVAVSVFIYLQSRKIKKLSKMSQTAETKFSDMENKLKTTSEKINLARTAARSRSSLPPEPPPEQPKTIVQIRTEKFEDLKRDYQEALDNFSKVAGFKQKWRGLALSRKERQETAKTVLINSSRSFEKSEIWCLSFEEKYVAFPGSNVKKDMATYMNLDFERATREFKGIFNITSGSSYSVKPCTLRRGGAGFVVEHAGEIQFPK